MNEYEMVDLLHSANANMLTGQAIYFTQLASYLVVAYVVGHKLSRFQVFFLNSLFIVLTFMGLSNFSVLLRRTLALSEQLAELESIAVTSSDIHRGVAISVYITFRILILAGALLFMWQIRHSDKVRPE